MYRELLAELIQKYDSASLQEPCSEQELEAAEQSVGYAFPAELKALLRETNGDRFLLLSAGQIMERTESARTILAECFDDAEEFQEKIVRHIFFATNGCGDYYCYRVLPNGEADTTAIYRWEHETFEHCIVAKDIPDLIVKYYNDEV